MLLDVHEGLDQLPDEDIESILTKLRAEAPGLDTNRAEDREKITGIISSTLSDKNSRIQKRVKEVEDAWAKEVHALRAEKDAESRELQRRMAELDSKKAGVVEAERAARIEAEKQRDRNVGIYRFWIAFIGMVVLGGVAGWLIGEIWLRSVTELSGVVTWLAPTVLAPLGVLLLAKQLFLRKLVGEQRIYAMPQPYRHILGE